MSRAVFDFYGRDSGSTLRRIPLTVNNARACGKITLNFIKHQIFRPKNIIFCNLFFSFAIKLRKYCNNLYLCAINKRYSRGVSARLGRRPRSGAR